MKKGECAIMKEAYKQKQIIIDEIKDKFERAESAVVIDYIGITVAEADAMRKKLREADVDYTVYKNTLVKRAIEGTKSKNWEASLRVRADLHSAMMMLQHLQEF